MKKHLLLAACVALMGQATTATAATYSDESAFLAATASLTLAQNDFESAPLSGTTGSGALPSIDFGDFSVSSTPDAVKVINQTFFGTFNTTPGGSQYLYLDTDAGSVGSLTTVTFDTAITAFGFTYTGFNEPSTTMTLSVGGETAPFIFTGNNGTGFLGYVGAAITSFSIDSGNDSGYGIDDFYYQGASAAVPLPAGLPLILTGLAAFGVARRSKRRQAAT